ncbi:hypothetical protein AAHA92_10244 [Salvia divinorum]|uniref:DDE Tnp4 domain-containing protein n=1 Tax=Salvia divinorum TaxID=28513 RepID=A0ABD1HWL6_SALDI
MAHPTTKFSHLYMMLEDILVLKYSVLNKIPDQLKHLDRLVNVTDADCISNFRTDCSTFGATVLNCVHKVLAAIVSLHSVLLCKPTPVLADCNNHRWKWFKGCLGALDSTHINVLVSASDKPRYRTRKGQIATNTLAVCDQNMQFVYFLPGWEGSAGDSRVLRDAVSRPHGLKVPQGCYYLCDNARKMAVDPIEAELDGDLNTATPDEQFIGFDYVECVEPTLEWIATRDNLALNMWNNK